VVLDSGTRAPSPVLDPEESDAGTLQERARS